MKSIIVYAPASTCLFGEHAVLAGEPAILCALDQWLQVKLVPNKTNTIEIRSALGDLTIPLNELAITAPLEFVTAALCQDAIYFKNGFTLTIKSDFSHQQGLASSAAVTVATVTALSTFLNLRLSKDDLFRKSKEVMLRVQGKGSGADVATAIYGGCIEFQKDKGFIRHFDPPAFTLIYSGAKTPTTAVIETVYQQLQAFPTIKNKIYDGIAACVTMARSALQSGDLKKLGFIANIHFGFQVALQTSDSLLSELIFEANQCPTVTGAKISGSGLGDCAIAFGTLPKDFFPKTSAQKKAGVQQLRISPSLRGVYVDGA